RGREAAPRAGGGANGHRAPPSLAQYVYRLRKIQRLQAGFTKRDVRSREAGSAHRVGRRSEAAPTNIRRQLMEIGVDSFVAATVDAAGRAVEPARHLSDLLEAITLADDVGLDVFGIGEHHRREFLDSAPTMIL